MFNPVKAVANAVNAVTDTADAVASTVADTIGAVKNTTKNAIGEIGNAGVNVFQAVTEDPIETLFNPSSAVANFLDAQLKDMGFNADYRTIARTVANPFGELTGLSDVNWTKKAMEPVNLAGDALRGGLKVIGGTAVDVGEYAVAVGIDGTKKAGETIAVMHKGTNEFLEGLFDSLTEGQNKVELPNGAQIGVTVSESIVTGVGVLKGEAAAVFGTALEGIVGAKVGGRTGASTHDGAVAGTTGTNAGTEVGGTTVGEGLGKYQGMLDQIGEQSDKITTIQDSLSSGQIEDPPGSGDFRDMTDNEKLGMQMELQTLMQQRMQMITLLTNLMKQEHDQAMAVINNIR